MSRACLVLVAFNLVGCQYIAPPDIDTPSVPCFAFTFGTVRAIALPQPIKTTTLEPL
ncbi:hypothetical protein [Trichocoleus sp. DQ-U1]|uniref:hypothetical protein n=1 Tax=Trichocoleus sp. DQ-U1 TaxID=2933926 RepID=UPI003297A9E4